MSASVIGGTSGARSRRTVRITATGIWTPPAGVNEVEAIIIGGGSGGGGGGGGLYDNTAQTTTDSGAVGGAGGAGAYARRITVPVTPGVPMPVIVGAGGTGGTGGTGAGGPQTTTGTFSGSNPGNNGSAGTASVFAGIRVPGAGQGGAGGTACQSQTNQVSGSSPTLGTPLTAVTGSVTTVSLGAGNIASQAVTIFGGASPGGGSPNTSAAQQFAGFHAVMRAGYQELLGPFAAIELPAYAQAGGGGGGGSNGSGVNNYSQTNWYACGGGGPGGPGEASYGGLGGTPMQATATGPVAQTNYIISGNYIQIAPANQNAAGVTLAASIMRGVDGVAATAPGAGGGGGGGAGMFRGPGTNLPVAVTAPTGGAGGAGGAGIVILTWEE